MYVRHNNETHSCNVCTSSAILAAPCHSTGRQRLYGDSTAPATISRSYVFGAACPILSDGNQICVEFLTIFTNFTKIRSVGPEPIYADGQLQQR